MTISTEGLRKLLDEATPGQLSAHKSAVFDAHGHCIAICTTGINRVEDDQANAKGMALWRDLAAELIAARAKIEAAKSALVDAQELAHGVSFSKDKTMAEWGHRVEAATMAAWESLK